uniref:Expressed protein n=1 Tax=Schizophyllum commune (strain H4-8 / FGSC 9210) TaxID=578458 RepID=D8PZT4_SCHCM
MQDVARNECFPLVIIVDHLNIDIFVIESQGLSWTSRVVDLIYYHVDQLVFAVALRRRARPGRRSVWCRWWTTASEGVMSFRSLPGCGRDNNLWYEAACWRLSPLYGDCLREHVWRTSRQPQ